MTMSPPTKYPPIPYLQYTFPTPEMLERCLKGSRCRIGIAAASRAKKHVNIRENIREKTPTTPSPCQQSSVT